MRGLQNGIWLLVGEREHFLPTAEFPWFADARVREVYQVELLHGHILHWPALDVDLDLESIDHPDRFPLVSRAAP